jgi:alkylation response protein AidB-like acyl-CoA dehydrogenase
MAKAAASDALWRTTSRGVQLHGGFGFTWDCDMHFYFRRALHDRGALGDPDSLRRQLAAALFA